MMNRSPKKRTQTSVTKGARSPDEGTAEAFFGLIARLIARTHLHRPHHQDDRRCRNGRTARERGDP